MLKFMLCLDLGFAGEERARTSFMVFCKFLHKSKIQTQPGFCMLGNLLCREFIVIALCSMMHSFASTH